ncbi:MAG TPA: hydrolase [Lachnospiraceae bacterium]|nr:hydrolase [Lachnospiraceae bacterium]
MNKIADFADGQHIVDCYLVRDKLELVTKAGKDYMKLILEDSSRTINGMVWDLESALIGSFRKGDVVKVDAFVQTYQGALQLNIVRIRQAKAGEYKLEDLFKVSKKDPEDLYQQALAMIDQIRDPGLKQLVEYFYKLNPNTIKKLKQHPAAKSIHHDYVGGLLEHSVTVAEYAVSFQEAYPQMDKDLLIAGGLLHDIGKLSELAPIPLNDYTDSGRLLGHITIGYQMVHEAGARIGLLSQKKLLQLEHMILSHHGEREFGSPVVPETMEAMALHMADLCDSHLKQMEEQIETDRTEGSWTAYNRVLDRYIYKPEESDER